MALSSLLKPDACPPPTAPPSPGCPARHGSLGDGRCEEQGQVGPDQPLALGGETLCSSEAPVGTQREGLDPWAPNWKLPHSVVGPSPTFFSPRYMSSGSRCPDDLSSC